MRYRILLLATVLASGLAGAETIAVDNGIAVKQSDVPAHDNGPGCRQIRRSCHQGSGGWTAADLALGVSRVRRLFRARPRHSQRHRKLRKT
jgi:hypothetical protein